MSVASPTMICTICLEDCRNPAFQSSEAHIQECYESNCMDVCGIGGSGDSYLGDGDFNQQTCMASCMADDGYGPENDMCADTHDDQIGATSEARCLALAGCMYNAANDHCYANPSPGSDNDAACNNHPGATASCADVTVNGQPWFDSDGPEYDCAWYTYDMVYEGEYGDRCTTDYFNNGYSSVTACCHCGGGAVTCQPA